MDWREREERLSRIEYLMSGGFRGKSLCDAASPQNVLGAPPSAQFVFIGSTITNVPVINQQVALAAPYCNVVLGCTTIPQTTDTTDLYLHFKAAQGLDASTPQPTIQQYFATQQGVYPLMIQGVAAVKGFTLRFSPALSGTIFLSTSGGGANVIQAVIFTSQLSAVYGG